MVDAFANFASSTVATAPSPATSGTSLVVAAGQGGRFPAVPFNAVIWPSGASAGSTNSEIVRVTARSTDTLTITRAQESTSARTVVVGDQIAASLTKRTMDAIVALTSGSIYGINGLAADGSDEGAALNAAIAASPTGSTVLFPPGTIGTSIPIKLIAGRRYRGSGWAMASGTTIKQVAGSTISTSVVASDAYLDNATLTGEPITVENLVIDGNKANCGSSTARGITLLNYWSTIQDCYVVDAPSHGIVCSDVASNGTPVTNGSSAYRILRNWSANSGGDGIKVISQSTGGSLDGYCQENAVATCGTAGINIDNGAGWNVNNNHIWGIGTDGISVGSGYATHIAANYIETFGETGTASTWYSGISLTVVDGYGSVVTDNHIGCGMVGGSSTYVWVLVQGGSGRTGAQVSCNGNVLHGPGTGTGYGLILWGSGGILLVAETGNVIGGITTPLDIDEGVRLQPAQQFGDSSLIRPDAAWLRPAGDSTTVSANGLVATAIGTATAANWANSSSLASVKRISYISAAGAGSSGGVKHNVLQWWRGNAAGLGGFYLVVRFGLATIPATRRWFVGMYGSTTSPTNADISSQVNLVGVGQDAADTAVQFMHNDGSGTATKNAGSSSLSSPAANEIWELRLWVPPGGGNAGMTVERLATSSARDSGTVSEYLATTDLPATTTGLLPILWANNATTASAIDPVLVGLYIQSNL